MEGFVQPVWYVSQQTISTRWPKVARGFEEERRKKRKV